MKKYVAYYRVSTNKQSLGIDVQHTSINQYIKGNGEIIAEYQEKESGKKNNRTELMKAIEYAKANEAVLIIAKLDRLSRSAGFIFQLKDSGVDFVCADMPEMNTLTLGIFATIAQHERELISQRTKDALTELKKQGVKLGSPDNLTDKSRDKARIANMNNALNNEDNRKAVALIKSLRQQGYTYQKVADELNNTGYKTRRGNKFYPMSVKQLEKQFIQ